MFSLFNTPDLFPDESFFCLRLLCPESGLPPSACVKVAPEPPKIVLSGASSVPHSSGCAPPPATRPRPPTTDAIKLLDRAGQKNIIHKNAAARQKSRLAKLVGAKKA